MKIIYETLSVQKLDLNKLPMEEGEFHPSKEVDEIILATLKINLSFNLYKFLFLILMVIITKCKEKKITNE